MVYRSNRKTRPTRPRIMMGDMASARPLRYACPPGRTKDTRLTNSKVVMAKAAAQSHHSRRSVFRKLARIRSGGTFLGSAIRFFTFKPHPSREPLRFQTASAHGGGFATPSELR